MKTTDIVYVLGTGSHWNNNEIRYSLRSLEENGIGYGKIFVVGTRPDFLSDDVIHIVADDHFNPSVNADGNIILKVLAACSDERLSDDFLFINDDHLLLKPYEIADIPPFHKGDMNGYGDDYFKNNYWRGRLLATRTALNAAGLTALHYDCHTPIVFNKYKFREVVEQFRYGDGIGLTMKSLYGNSVYGNSGKLLVTEKKTVFNSYRLRELEARLAQCELMSFNDNGLNDSLKAYLYYRFPRRSRWEINDSDDKIAQLLRWRENGCDYAEGLKIAENHSFSRNIMMLMLQGNSELLVKKLNYKLNQIISEL